MPETTFHTTFSTSHFLLLRAKNGSESGLRSAVSYRFGFNGKENDNEVKGTGNQQDYGMRIYDPRLGRWLSRDPDKTKYPQWSTYNAFVCNPIIFTDPSGKGAVVTIGEDANGNTQIKVSAAIYIYSSVVDKIELANIADKMQCDTDESKQKIEDDANSRAEKKLGRKGTYLRGKTIWIKDEKANGWKALSNEAKKDDSPF